MASILVNLTVKIMATNSFVLIRGFSQSNSRQQRFQRGHPFGRGSGGRRPPAKVADSIKQVGHGITLEREDMRF